MAWSASVRCLWGAPRCGRCRDESRQGTHECVRYEGGATGLGIGLSGWTVSGGGVGMLFGARCEGCWHRMRVGGRLGGPGSGCDSAMAGEGLPKDIDPTA
jgi:hypothetical protein